MTELPGQLADPGRYLRAQRELADVSRNTLARLARVSESYLTQVEKGQSSRLLRPGRPGPARTNRGHGWATAAPDSPYLERPTARAARVATAAISLAVTRSHRRHVHSSSATSEPGRVPPRSPRSRLTASPWRVLDLHPQGDWTRSRHSSSESRAAASSSIAVAFGPHRPKLRQPRQPRLGSAVATPQ